MSIYLYFNNFEICTITCRKNAIAMFYFRIIMEVHKATYYLLDFKVAYVLISNLVL